MPAFNHGLTRRTLPRKSLLAVLLSAALSVSAQAPAPVPARPASNGDQAPVATPESSVDAADELPTDDAELMEGVEVTAEQGYAAGAQDSVVEEKRSSANVTEVIGAEQIARSGDSDAAGALKRVTGLTLVDSKFVYVRGLGERYSSTLLNGAQIPSPDPTRRVVPLDLFPAEILESIAIQKTYSPEMPGEFGGGTIQLRTRGVPNGFIAKFALNGSYYDGSSFDDGLTYRGDGQDWTGFEGGARDLPGAIADRIAADGRLRPRSTFNPGGVTPAEFEAFGEQFAGLGFDQKEETLDPGLGGSALLGNAWEMGDIRFGFLSSLRYENAWNNTEEKRRVFRVEGTNTLVLGSELDRKRTEQLTDLSALLNFGVEFGLNHRLKATSTLVRQTADEARFTQGFTEDPGDMSRFYQLQWEENFLLSHQLSGSHTFENLGFFQVDWQYTHARSGRDAPANRQYRYDQDNNSRAYLFSSRADSNSTDYSELDDSSDEFSVGVRYPWQISDSTELTLLGGVNSLKRDRESGILRFVYRSVGPASRDPAVLIGTPNRIFAPGNIGPNGFQFDQTGRDTDFYTAEQDLDAVYAGIDLNYQDLIRVAIGARQEKNQQRVTTVDPTQNGAEPSVADLDDNDVLPALTATWYRSLDDQLRFAYSQTVSRPDFRELSLAPFTDPILDTETIGNPDLVATKISNYDLRWEYYFSETETFSAAVFYKDFDKPIERVLVPGTGELLSYINVDKATNYGIEFDVYKSLSALEEMSFANPDWLPTMNWPNWYVSANYTRIESKVELGSAAAIQTTRNRPLQGQSPYVTNVQIGYINPDSGRESTLSFNRFGGRISNVGVRGAPDIYEEAFNQLDFVYRQNLPWSGWTVKARARNLLDPKVQFTQGSGVTREYRKGRELQLGVEWKF